MPYGLQICRKPVLGKSSESLLSQWDQVSRTSSVEFLRLAILESKYQLQHCSEDIEVTTNLIIVVVNFIKHQIRAITGAIIDEY